MSGILVPLLTVASLIFIVRVILSWIRISPDSPFAVVSDGIYKITEPVLAPIRNMLPRTGGIDFSTLIVILIINLILIPIARNL